jgi:three-Cys-motif partner protein
MSNELIIDEIGYWSEIKLSILEKYAKPFNQILLSNRLKPIYIDGFAGAGMHVAKGTDRLVEGSPVRALNVQPPFDHLHFVDLDESRAVNLEKIADGRKNVSVYQGNCNVVLVNEVFPKISFANRQRALCILDPYGLHLDWETIRIAGQSKIIEIFLNFPMMDMNRNVLRHDKGSVSPQHQQRMDKFWGDDSWKSAAYQSIPTLFGETDSKNTNDVIAEAFRKRLKDAAGFNYVPRPMPMRNSKGAVVYYLFFAAPNKTASKIVEDIFEKYGHRREETNG